MFRNNYKEFKFTCHCAECLHVLKNILPLAYDISNTPQIYIAGESYAGVYVPFIASQMLDAKDSNYFNVEGTMIYDPSINSDLVLTNLVAVPFVNYWKDLFALNDTFMADINARDVSCGYKAYRDKNLVYPPKGKLPTPPGSASLSQNCDLYDEIQTAALEVNPVRKLQNPNLYL
jgi:carboxypeptidase D